VNYNILTPIFRLLGNSCADTSEYKLQTSNKINEYVAYEVKLDENRARVVEAGVLEALIRFLENHDDLLTYVLAALFNICVDYGK
jgi:hypothetical protein